jgi:hypothetical protein
MMKKVEKLDIDNMKIVSNDVDETLRAACCIFAEMEKEGFSEVDVLTALCLCTVEYAINFEVEKHELMKNMESFWNTLLKVRGN